MISDFIDLFQEISRDLWFCPILVADERLGNLTVFDAVLSLEPVATGGFAAIIRGDPTGT